MIFVANNVFFRLRKIASIPSETLINSMLILSFTGSQKNRPLYRARLDDSGERLGMLPQNPDTQITSAKEAAELMRLHLPQNLHLRQMNGFPAQD